MKSLVESVQKLSMLVKHSPNQRDFLNSTMTDPNCQAMVRKMAEMTPQQLGIEGNDDPLYFKGPLNRVTIAQYESDYRLVLFFIQKGAKMYMHDHPNMSVFFRLVQGRLSYVGYDKLHDKYRYN